MTINIHWDGELNKTNRHYLLLSPNNKKFLCPDDLIGDMSLPTMFILTHIGFVSEESIKHIIGRLDFANGVPIKDKLEDRSKKWGYESLEDHLRVFIGVGSNWPTLSKADFVKLIARFSVPNLSSPDLRRMLVRRNMKASS